MKSILQAQVDMAPQVYESELKYQPLYNQLEAQQQAYQAQQSLDMAKKAYPQIAEIESAYNQANRQAELGQLQTALPQYQQAFNALTPGYAEAVGSAGQLAKTAMAQSMNRPEFNSYQVGVRDPYGAQRPAPQQQMPAQQQGGGKQTPPQPANAPQGGFAGQMQQQFAQQPNLGGFASKTLQQPAQTSVLMAPPAIPAPEAELTPEQQDRANNVIRLTAGNSTLAAQPSAGSQLLGQSIAQPSQMQGPALPPGFQAQNSQAGQAQQGGGKGTPPPPQGPGGNFSGQMQQRMQGQQQMAPQQPYSGLQETPAGGYVNAVQGFTPTNVAYGAGMPQEAGYLNQAQTIQSAAAAAGAVPTAANMGKVAGPKLASNIQNLDQKSVNQYIAAMPGMGQYADMLAQQSQAELSAGRSLTPEEQRMADQSARAAYAARGTALGNQAVNAEILNRADVANQRYQQRLQNAAQAAGTIQGIYQPALQQSMQRQQLGIDYGLSQQNQAFGQAQARDTMAQQLQAQRYNQAMGTQGAGFEQAATRENVNQGIQQQRYNQLMGQQQLMQGAQEQAYNQAMGREQLGAGTQQAAFNQALQRGSAEQQAYMASTQAQAAQAQLGAGAMSQLQQAQAPILQAFYKQPILQGVEGQSQQMGLAMQQQAGPQYFNPESQTGMGSIYGAYNSQMNLAGAQAQANAAVQAGKYAMIGNIAGSFGAAAGAGAGKCWVAREVYGEHNPTWLIFREWLTKDAPKWFHDLYCKYGERFAKFISNKPKLKQLVKAWMDSKIS